MTARVLVAEGDAVLGTALCEALKAAGYVPYLMATGSTALDHGGWHDPDLVLLDTDLPDLDALDACRRLRASSPVPIILLSDRTDEIDRIVAYEVGVDDYIVKPCSVREIVLRVRALLRIWYASALSMPPEPVCFGDVHVDLQRQEVIRAGQPVELTHHQYGLLSFLVRNPGRVFTRQQLLTHVWGPEHTGDPRVVNVQLHYLRQKLEEHPDQPRYLRTIRSRNGYLFEPLTGPMASMLRPVGSDSSGAAG